MTKQATNPSKNFIHEYHELLVALKFANTQNAEILAGIERNIIINAIEQTEPLRELQREWMTFLLELQNVKAPLLNTRGNSIFLNDKEITARNKKQAAISLLLLKILLSHSDPNGFIAYENIEKKFIKLGIKRKQTKAKANERIRNAKKDIYRFLRIPKTYNGIEIIATIKGKGLQLNNPQVPVKL